MFTDCMVVCQDQDFPCHRAVLASASPVFERMLNTDMRVGNERRIDVDDVEPCSMKALLKALYIGEGSSNAPAPEGIALSATKHKYAAYFPFSD